MKQNSQSRWPWLAFGLILMFSITLFVFSANWSTQSLWDIAAFGVSIVGIVSVMLYALRFEGRAPTFWSWFRWAFVGVLLIQGLLHALQVAERRGFSTIGTFAFLCLVTLLVGPIYFFQWAAMTRLATKKIDA